MRFITWNIDGLDKEGLFERTLELIPILAGYDVIFLQEVTEEVEEIIKSNMFDFYHYSGKSIREYFVMMLFRKTIVASEPVVNYKPFSNSQMGRGVLFSGVTTRCGQEILFMTTHLESMKEYGQARIEQLHHCFDFMNKTNADKVIFGGDLNARDAEIKSLSAATLEKFKDAWERCGKDANKKFTWDLLKNDNKSFGGGFKPRCRFDRVFTTASIQIDNFQLVGTEKVGSKFISDHFGISFNCL